MHFAGHLPGADHKYLGFEINFCAVPAWCCLCLSHLPRVPAGSDGSALGLLGWAWTGNESTGAAPAPSLQHRVSFPLPFPRIYCSYSNSSGGAQSWGDGQKKHPPGIPCWHCGLVAPGAPEGSSRGNSSGNTGKGLPSALQPPWEPLNPQPGQVWFRSSQ